MKNIRKIIVFMLVAAMMLCAIGCSSSTTTTETETSAEPAQTTTESTAPTETTETTESTETAETDSTATTTTPAEFDGKLHGPFLVTTCGQSTGSVMFHMVAKQAGAESTDEHELLAKEVPELGSGAKTLVVTTGTSGKGMGAAGTDVKSEISRCTEVIEAAREAGMTIVCAHIEGMSRRTDANDQASIDAILPLADVIVCVEDSNSDNLFSDYATENNIPIIIVPDSLSLAEYIEAE